MIGWGSVSYTHLGLYTAIKDIRQGKNANNGEFHESLNSLAAILGAGLVGIDKTNQDGYNLSLIHISKLLKNDANSIPITPPPTIAKEAGNSLLSKASLCVQMCIRDRINADLLY